MAKDGNCKYSKSKGVVGVETYHNVVPFSVTELKAAIAVNPVAVALEADNSVFQLYKSGVLNSSKCGYQIDHAVTAVGYGKEGNDEYYIVQNSWGAAWGDKGYIKIAAEGPGRGVCGIQQ